MIFYSDSMMRNYVNSLPFSEVFYVASYGFKDGLYNIPPHAKLLIAEPYFPDCKPDCEDCAKHRASNKEKLISALTGKNFKLVQKHHLKLIITDNVAIIGSRNLTGSEFEDLSIGVEDSNMIQALKEHFEYLWDKCGKSKPADFPKTLVLTRFDLFPAFANKPFDDITLADFKPNSIDLDIITFVDGDEKKQFKNTFFDKP